MKLAKDSGAFEDFSSLRELRAFAWIKRAKDSGAFEDEAPRPPRMGRGCQTQIRERMQSDHGSTEAVTNTPQRDTIVLSGLQRGTANVFIRIIEELSHRRMSVRVGAVVSRLRSAFVLFALAITMVAIASEATANEIVKNDRVAILHLINGDHITGTLVSSEFEDCLGWQSPIFASPFQFSLGGLASIHFTAPAELPSAEGSFSLELAGGDLLFGSLIGLNAETATLDVPGVGPLNIDRSTILRISRRGGENDVLFVGPSGLNGWLTPGDSSAWHEDAGHLYTDKQGAILRRDFGLPSQSRIEFELSWTGQPDFELAVGVDDNSKTVSRAYRFDVWENELVVQRETEHEANVEPLQKLQGKSGRIHIQAFLDQTLGRMLVYSSAGEPLADMTVTTGKKSGGPQIYGGLQLTNRRGDVRLERLQVGRWNGEVPRSVDVRNVDSDKSRIHDSDGAIIYGTLQSFDPDKREFVIGDENGPKSIAEDRVQIVFLSQSAQIAPRALRAVYLTGMKISGDVTRIENRTVWLKSPGISEPIGVPLDALQSLVVLKPNTDPPETTQRRGRLEIAGVTLHGCLVDGHEGESTCLCWQPIRSLTSSALLKGVAARIIYRDPPKVVVPNPEQQAGMAARQVPQRIVRKLPASKTKPSPNGSPGSKPKNTESFLHLRTGDTIECQVISVDEHGLTFKSSFSDTTFVPHEKIHAVELDPWAPQKEVDPKKRERLLTLPRMQRNNPPTQLFRDLDGDYLRGRLMGINDAQIQVELRLEGKLIPRDRVARIIWLHPELLTTSADDAQAAAKLATTNLVQALYSSEESNSMPGSQARRLTFHPERVEGSLLIGQSELFGVCKVDLQHVDELLIDSAIERVTADLPFGKWKLKQSLDPLGPKEGAENAGDGSEGQESALIGKIAPDISLKTLDGTKFNINDHRSKVVILDFWASWCGPCMQVMPQIDKVAEEFADQGVVLFAVNLEETPEKIKAALERLKLSPTVLLDKDGRVAERYGASSIPQTVIIDREGKVVRLFVGGGARFDEQLRTALKSVLSNEPPKSE